MSVRAFKPKSNKSRIELNGAISIEGKISWRGCTKLFSNVMKAKKKRIELKLF